MWTGKQNGWASTVILGGFVLPHIWARTLIVTALSIVVTILYERVPALHYTITPTPFTLIGLPLAQRKERFLLAPDAPTPPDVDPGLLWRSLADVGEERFLDAMERVSIGGLDMLNEAAIAERGMGSFAGDFLAVLRALDDHPAWWELAYDGTGALVGLIVPQRFTPDDGAINYIGVVPEMRGRGYVDILLSRGVRRLRENGVGRVIGDTDSRNAPMASAFLRAGFGEAGSRLVHHGAVASILDADL